jgi:hypothetical protein
LANDPKKPKAAHAAGLPVADSPVSEWPSEPEGGGGTVVVEPLARKQWWHAEWQSTTQTPEQGEMAAEKDSSQNKRQTQTTRFRGKKRDCEAAPEYVRQMANELAQCHSCIRVFGARFIIIPFYFLWLECLSPRY